ncbi:MAG: repressor LexA [Candidatus Dactylopiibacterium carminicum]|uniref:LexA repressor n=1 Tax=Candidatus Dactylopiibacterium carminicum TaxID=857335 RepID=A0A272EV13_9RHOO|nr:transcriptional repressor LexA [Candidatus Dactylopiibacterium carminicum]KAF7599850.1 transcriptional repressor LexA [Candidatus Dactylopiibacterium carminicum]PAS93961.1 MAG: repressor LexA [Candidatus Dactylopiibacterium carminicum]PAS97276.1 MAG: repressor LexA [Candidatus Dactylopiibacterium carminicum]PAS99850.1 MAG: repressor LexA [Candidatus Dactylopiibacterium carminicum]
MRQELTRRQQDILDFIREQIARNGMPPTRAEISAAFGFASPNAAESHLRALASKGVIVLESGSARGIRLPAGWRAEVEDEATGLPLIGRVAAGSPILAQAHVQRHVAVDPQMFSPRADYLLTVRGLSMINAGILEGDLLAVHATPQAREGQIVVARVDDDVTVKRLHSRPEGLIELQAENPDFSPILVDPARQSFAIEGIAVGLIRAGVTAF